MRQFIESFVKKVITAAPDEALAAVARLMDRHNVGAVVIVENHRPVGIVTDRDIALAVAARGLPAQTPGVRVLTSPIETIGSGEGVFQATQLMRERSIRRVAVVDEAGRIDGIVTFDDLLRLVGRELVNLIEGIQPEMEVR